MRTKKQLLKDIKERFRYENYHFERNFGYETYAQKCIRIVEELNKRKFGILQELVYQNETKVIISQCRYTKNTVGRSTRWSVNIIPYLVVTKEGVIIIEVPDYDKLEGYEFLTSWIGEPIG